MSAEPRQKIREKIPEAGWFPTKTTHKTTHNMKKSLITMMAAALMSVSAYAGEVATTDSFDTVQNAQEFKRLSGAVHVGVGTAYTLHGYVPTTAVVQGEGVGMGAVQLSYDFGKESAWSYVGGVSYKAPFSGHTLYGNPSMSRGQFVPLAAAENPAVNQLLPTGATVGQAWASGALGEMIPNLGAMVAGGMISAEQAAALEAANGKLNAGYAKYQKMGAKNIENEFIIRNGLKYTRDMWNASFGYDFIHGGIAGVVAKHFDGESESRMQQFWLNGEITPVAWFSADVNIARTFDTIDGWWFEGHARFKAPIIGSPEDITVAGILEFGVSATHDFYDARHNACDNGLQAYWVKFSAPWFVNDAKNFILTPSVSFNWLGRGGRQANKRSHAKAYGEMYQPFRDYAVVGELTASYKF